MNASKLGQQIRWVRQYNGAIARAFRHWATVKKGKASCLTKIVNFRAFSRHANKAGSIAKRRKLKLVRLDNGWVMNPPHSEPEYDSNKVRK